MLFINSFQYIICILLLYLYLFYVLFIIFFLLLVYSYILIVLYYSLVIVTCYFSIIIYIYIILLLLLFISITFSSFFYTRHFLDAGFWAECSANTVGNFPTFVSNVLIDDYYLNVCQGSVLLVHLAGIHGIRFSQLD